MTADEALAQHRQLIGEVGETVIVRRYSGLAPSRIKVDTSTTARVMGYRPNPLFATQVVQGDRTVIALVDDLSGILPVKTTDKLVVRGKEAEIKGVDDNTRRIGGTLIALELLVAG